jgi:Flp pilus assembly protein TadD
MARVRAEDRQLQSRLEAMQADLKAANQAKSDLQDQVRQLTAEVIRTDRRFEASIYLLTAQRDALAQKLKAASPGRPPDQIIEIAPTPAADQIRPSTQPPVGALPGLQTSPPAINRSLAQYPAGAADLAASVQGHYTRHEFSLAEAEDRKLLELAPQSSIALANLAAIEFGENRLAEAQTHITAALDQKTDDAANLALRGKIELARGENTDALMDLFQAAQMDPNNAGTQNDLGLTLNRMGQRDAAEAALNQAVQIDPHDALAQNNLALFYLAQNPPNTPLARWHYQKARENGEPRNPQVETWLDLNGAPADFLSGAGK